MISEFKTDIQSFVSRTEHIEKKMSELAKLHNALIDSHSALEEEVTRLSAKVLDLEKHSTLNNIRFRGIPESVPLNALRPFLTDLMAVTLPNCTQLDLTMNRIPKPKHLSPLTPRDTIAHIHFYQIKDDFLHAL